MDDSQIIDLYIRRSENAIAETDTQYGTLCRQLAMNILSCREDAEECVNDTYLGAWNAIPPLIPASLRAFVCGIVRNLALKKYAYVTAEKRNPRAAVSLAELEECVSGCGTPEETLDDAEIARVINGFLRTLDRRSRIMFLRRYWYFDPVADIAACFGISAGSVSSTLFRTRKKLRAYLLKEGIDL
jgi:RNA polymerase sigma-70 factor (ECF subfamily)